MSLSLRKNDPEILNPAKLFKNGGRNWSVSNVKVIQKYFYLNKNQVFLRKTQSPMVNGKAEIHSPTWAFQPLEISITAWTQGHTKCYQTVIQWREAWIESWLHHQLTNIKQQLPLLYRPCFPAPKPWDLSSYLLSIYNEGKTLKLPRIMMPFLSRHILCPPAARGWHCAFGSLSSLSGSAVWRILHWPSHCSVFRWVKTC